MKVKKGWRGSTCPRFDHDVSVELLGEDGLLIVEHYHKNELENEIGSLRRRRRLKQGESALSFYEKEDM